MLRWCPTQYRSDSTARLPRTIKLRVYAQGAGSGKAALSTAIGAASVTSPISQSSPDKEVAHPLRLHLQHPLNSPWETPALRVQSARD